MRDTTPSSGPEGPATPHTGAPAQPGQRSGEGSDSVLEHLLKDTSLKAANASVQQRAPARTDHDAQAAR